MNNNKILLELVYLMDANNLVGFKACLAKNKAISIDAHIREIDDINPEHYDEHDGMTPGYFDNKTLMMAAISENKIEFISELIKAGANVNFYDESEENRSILMYAIEYGCEEAIRLLIAAGADLEFRDDNGDSAIDTAIDLISYDYAPKNITSCVDILIEKGAYLNKKEALLDNITNWGVVNYLIEKNVDINNINRDGNTPFMYLVMGINDVNDINAVSLMQLLVDAGAKTTLVNKDNETALDIYRRVYADYGEDEIYEFIKAAQEREQLATLVDHKNTGINLPLDF